MNVTWVHILVNKNIVGSKLIEDDKTNSVKLGLANFK